MSGSGSDHESDRAHENENVHENENAHGHAHLGYRLWIKRMFYFPLDLVSVSESGCTQEHVNGSNDCVRGDGGAI